MIDNLLKKYLKEYVDEYDDMDGKIKKVKTLMRAAEKKLQRAGYQIWEVFEPDYDIDGMIDIGNGWTIQITLDKEFLLAYSGDGRRIVPKGEAKDINGIISILKQLKYLPKEK